MKNLTLIIAMSLGLIVLGTYANSAAHRQNVNVQREWIHDRSKRGIRKNFDVETDFETILDITRNADGMYLNIY